MPWEKQFDERAVLAKAMRHFWQHGYSGSSMQALVDATGVHRASLYATFGDKHGLFMSALRLYDEAHRRRALASLEARYPPREAIRRLLLSFASTRRTPQVPRGCFLSNTALELAAHDDEARSLVAAAQLDLQGFLERMIARGAADGTIVIAHAPREVAAGLLAALIGITVLARSRPEPALMRGIVDDAMQRLG